MSRWATGAAAGGGRGFTLVEVLVAFAILAFSLAVIARIFSTGAQSSRAADAVTLATLLAESSLASIGIEAPLREGQDSGAWDSGFRWRSTVQLFESETPADLALADVRLYEVSVTVSWNVSGGERSVSLSTLRLAPRPRTRP